MFQQRFSLSVFIYTPVLFTSYASGKSASVLIRKMRYTYLYKTYRHLKTAVVVVPASVLLSIYTHIYIDCFRGDVICLCQPCRVDRSLHPRPYICILMRMYLLSFLHLVSPSLCATRQTVGRIQVSILPSTVSCVLHIAFQFLSDPVSPFQYVAAWSQFNEALTTCTTFCRIPKVAM